MFFLAQTVTTWSEIAEKLGIPFAILLMFSFFFAGVCVWLGRHVVKPVTAGHIDFMKKCGSAIQTLQQQEIEQTAAIRALTKGQDQTLEAVQDVQSHVKQLKGMVARRDSRSSSGSGETAPAA